MKANESAIKKVQDETSEKIKAQINTHHEKTSRKIDDILKKNEVKEEPNTVYTVVNRTTMKDVYPDYVKPEDRKK